MTSSGARIERHIRLEIEERLTHSGRSIKVIFSNGIPRGPAAAFPSWTCEWTRGRPSKSRRDPSNRDDMNASWACLDIHLGHIEGAGDIPHHDSVAAHRKSGSRQRCGIAGTGNRDRANGVSVDEYLRLGAGGGAGGSETHSKLPLG